MFQKKNVALVLSTLLWHAAAHGQDRSVTLSPIVVTDVHDAGQPEFAAVLPDSGRPQTVIPRQTIENVASPFADFGILPNLTPSFVSTAPNGTGFDAAKNMTLRGFPDGQFNITLDGIPFQDPDTFSHHSTSFFPASSIDSVVVDRSPGDAITLGYATIGGSVNMNSVSLPAKSQAQAYGAYGSFATSLAGARLATAAPREDGQTGVLLNVQDLQSNGALSWAEGHRNDILFKSESRFGGARLTALYAYDWYHFNNPPSVTTAQIAQFGRDFGFSANPASPAFYGYSATDRRSDFGYLRLQTPLDGAFTLQETLYTYSYWNKGLSLKGDPTSSPVGNGFGVNPSDTAGRTTETDYRTFGNVLQVEHSDGDGIFRSGLWLERSHLKSQRNALDVTTGAVYNINKNANSPLLYDYRSLLETVQPYVEYEWQALPRLLIEPGLRYQHVHRGFDANVVPNSLPGTNGDIGRTVNSWLPSLEVKYRLTPATHVYAQWAKGALVPSQSFFYTSNPGQSNQAKPETSRAMQGGVVYTAGPLTAALDAYWIELKDYVSTVTLGGNTQFVNNGRVRYRGIEAETTVPIAGGFTAVANGSVMEARFRDAGVVSPAQQAGDTISLVPSYTALAGVLYQRGLWTASVYGRFVGAQYQGKNGSSDGVDFRVKPYHYTNLALSRSLDDWIGHRHSALGIQINNLENRDDVTDTAGPSAAGPRLVNVLPRRSVMVTLRCDLWAAAD